MKRLFHALLMCFSMFTAIPVPGKIWDEDARPVMTLFLPLVGLFIGAAWSLLAYLLGLSALPGPVRAAILCAYPFLVTGGIHFDGYLDVTDALKSWREPEERRRILKDPNVGSFAVLAGALLIMAQFALFASAGEDTDLVVLALIPTVSRTISALAVTVLRPMSVSEYSGAYRRGVKRSHAAALSALLALELAAGFVLSGLAGLSLLGVALGYIHHARRAFRSLDGMSGDISGYALTFGELCGVAVLVLI